MATTLSMSERNAISLRGWQRSAEHLAVRKQFLEELHANQKACPPQRLNPSVTAYWVGLGGEYGRRERELWARYAAAYYRYQAENARENALLTGFESAPIEPGENPLRLEGAGYRIVPTHANPAPVGPRAIGQGLSAADWERAAEIADAAAERGEPLATSGTEGAVVPQLPRLWS